MKTIGIIIADDNEFIPFLSFGVNMGGIKTQKRSRAQITFGYKDRKIIIVYSGVGKVNAAMAAAHMISENDVEIMLNAGLSGCLGDFQRGDILAGKELVEVDFDITAAGIKPGEKTGQEYIYKADTELLEKAVSLGGIKTAVLGTNDRFLTDENLKQSYRKIFGIDAIDMESAAIASVCHFSGVRFLSLRKLADSANENAIEEYREMDSKQETDLCELIFKLIDAII